ncbi:MAG: energy transducer TonB [Thermodesulfovibrionales bacterium]
MEVSIVEEMGTQSLVNSVAYSKGVGSPELSLRNMRFFVRSGQTQIPPESEKSDPSNEYGSQDDIRRRDDRGEGAHSDISTQNLSTNTVTENIKGDDNISAGQRERISGDILFSQKTGFADVNKQPEDGRDSFLLSAIRTAIENAKTYPLLARKRGMEGTVIVSFKIDRKGLPYDIKILKSSGYKILDEEVQRMLRKASPFPELDGEIAIPITFRLK